MKLLAKSILAVAAFGVATAARADGELNLFGWSEYIPQEVLDGFTQETGIKVNFETYASNEEMLSKLVAGGVAYDIVQPSDYTAELMIRRKMLAPLDFSQIPNAKNISQEFMHLPHDPDGKFTIPYMAGTVGIVVNTEVVKDPIKGYKDIFAPKFKDRLVVLADNREIVTWALYSVGLSSSDVKPADLAKVRPIVAEWVKLVKVFDSDSPKTALTNGDVDIGVVWSGEAAILWNENKKFQYVLPEEGAHLWVDQLAIPVGSEHKEIAHKFINYLLRPEVSKLVSDKFPYTNPNLEARKLLTAEQLANPASYPATGANLKPFRDIGRAAADIDKLVTDLKSSQ